VYVAKTVANIIFPANSWLSFQRLRRLLWGYHFHFVDSNRGSNNYVIPVPSSTRSYSGLQDVGNRHV